mgnify:CR=1 FL=1
MRTTPLYFPPQKIPMSKKTAQWYRECIDGAESLAILRTDGALNHHYKMQVWENLDNDIIDENEIEKVFNPMQISNAVFPAAIKNYPLSVPKIDLLHGEEIKRRFDWKVLARNEDAYSTQTMALKDAIMQVVIDEINNEAFSEEDAQRKIQEVSKYFKYEYKDLNELYATRVLEYLWREQDLRLKFSQAFRDALVKGREIYRIDNIGGEPGVIKADPKNTYFIRRGESHRIEDSDIIVEISYAPVGKVIDEFYDYLTPAHIEQLEAGIQKIKQNAGGILNHQNAFPILMGGTEIGGTVAGDNGFNAVGVFNLPFDYEGNVRICRARWIGRKKIGKLKYFDPNTGNEEERFVSENYKVKEELGESVKWIWVNEAYEGTRLAEDIYVKTQPRDVQMRHFDNPSKCFLGYVGTDYGKSLMSRMEPYQYLYNVYMRRLELAIAKYKGPIYEMDISTKPDDWDIEMWMYYADVLGWSIKDAFNEGKKGQATGKIAGNLNNQTKVLDANAGNYIQQLVMMLQYIEKQMGQIAGVNEQRQGQVDNRETLGGIERAVTQSSHITEKWFFIHEETKKRVLLALLDTAKQIWKNKKSKKINFIMDDMSRATMDINGEDFSSTEYDIFISDSSDDLKIRQTLESLAQAYVQNGGSMTLPIKILRSDSITQMAKQIEEEEAALQQRQSEAENKKIESDQAIQQAILQDKQAEREFQYWKVEKESEVKLQIAGMQPAEDTTIDEEKLNLDKQKLDNEKIVKDKEFSLKQQQLSETKRHNIEAEKISKIKKATTPKSK